MPNISQTFASSFRDTSSDFIFIPNKLFPCELFGKILLPDVINFLKIN